MMRGMAAWHKWMTDNAASVVTAGGPLGKTKKIGKDGITDIRNRDDRIHHRAGREP